MKPSVPLALSLALLGACALETVDDVGPDAGDEVPQFADPDEIAWCWDPYPEPTVRLVSKGFTSITVEVDAANPSCRWRVWNWELWAANDPPPLFISEILDSGGAGELPVQYTQTGLIPGAEYCYAGRINQTWEYRGGCWRTNPLTIKW